jgi:hypothetical protein
MVGIPQGVQKVRGALLNRNGNQPFLEPKPPLKAIADPANLESPDAAIKKAAEVKMAEDLKKQKIKAVKYLTEIGCGCYDADGGVSAALAASMTDCTEDVRYETITAIAEAAQGKCCSRCGQVCCCNKTILTQLAKTAYERDDTGCYVEPSERVREAAAEALRICCPNTTSPLIVPSEDGDREVPGDTTEPEREAAEGEGTEPPVPPSAEPPAEEQLPRGDQAYFHKPLRGTAVGGPAGWAVVLHVSVNHRLAHIHLNQENSQLAVGTVLPVHRTAENQLTELGQLQVVESFPGSANVTGSKEVLALLKRGDVALVPAATAAVQPTQNAEPLSWADATVTGGDHCDPLCAAFDVTLAPTATLGEQSTPDAKTLSPDFSSRKSLGHQKPLRAAFDGEVLPAANAAEQPMQAAELKSLNDAARTHQGRQDALRAAFDSAVDPLARR